MVYQVMIRRGPDFQWEPFEATTSDPFAAMRLIQKANVRHPEVTVLQAANVGELSALLGKIRAGIVPHGAVSPVPGITSTTRVTVMNDEIEQRRWSLERGSGGDHDSAYRFSLPASQRVLSSWVALMERHRDTNE